MGAFSLCDGLRTGGCCVQDHVEGPTSSPSSQKELLAAHAGSALHIAPWHEEDVQNFAKHNETTGRPTKVVALDGDSEDANETFSDRAAMDLTNLANGDSSGSAGLELGLESLYAKLDKEAVGSSFCPTPKRSTDVASTDIDSISRHSASSTSGGEHPILQVFEMIQSINLVKGSRFKNLPVPLPRWQEITDDWFGLPTGTDMVVAVSHGWRNQSHPDPNGWKREAVSKFLSGTGGDSEVSEVYVFMDFLSIPQRPFLPGQPDRTQEEQKVFTTALQWMHKMYFLADRVIHLGYREDEKVEGEGEVYYVPLSSLDSARFALLDGWVQIVGTSAPVRWSQPGDQQQRWGLFDRVMAIGDVEITDPLKIQELRIGSLSSKLWVKCMRFPFGRVNNTPADERGWVFLERFITACKVAMLPGEAGEKVIITDTPAIKDEIIAYASLLRRAAEKDRASGSSSTPNLSNLMSFFQEELGRKSFSASSTDKFLIDQEVESSEINRRQSVIAADREVVTGVMREFVLHLSTQWNLEQAAQRTRAQVLANKLKDYWYGWNHFSQEFYTEVCRNQPWWPMVLLVLLPAVPWAAVNLVNYGSPLEPWSTQALYLGYYVPIFSTTTLATLSFCTGEAFGVRTNFRQAILYLTWAVCGTIWVMAVPIPIGINSGTFPIPLGAAKGALASSMALPFLGFTIPRSMMADKESVTRLMRLIVNTGVAQIIGGGILPQLNSLLRRSHGDLTHMGFICLFLLTKLSFEKIGEFLYPKVGADAMPIIVFSACVTYELNLCIAMSSGFSFGAFFLLLAIDAIENGYHLWCLHRDCKAAKARKRHTAPKFKHGYARFASVGERRDAFILCSLLIREFLEMTTAMVYIVEVSLSYHIAPRNNDLVCAFRPEDYQRTIAYLVIDLLVEGVMAVFTWFVVVSHGFQPMAVLRGVIARYFPSFLTMACASHMYFLGQSHSHNGMDLTYEFPWEEGNVEWICGLKYRVNS